MNLCRPFFYILSFSWFHPQTLPLIEEGKGLVTLEHFLALVGFVSAH